MLRIFIELPKRWSKVEEKNRQLNLGTSPQLERWNNGIV